MNKDISHATPLPKGLPALALVGRGVDHKFVVLPVLVDPEHEGEFFVGLVIAPWHVEVLAFCDTFDEGLELLRSIMSGFRAIGFDVQHATIEKEDEDAPINE